jgi:cobalamin biosynthesis Mg chelatase CobN
LEKKPVAVISTSVQAKVLNAESVTIIATSFLKRIGNKGSLKPKRVSLEEGTYTVEIEMKKLSAVVRVDSETREIKGYEIQPRGEEVSSSAVSPKLIMIVVGVAVVIHIGLNFILEMFGL